MPSKQSKLVNSMLESFASALREKLGVEMNDDDFNKIVSTVVAESKKEVKDLVKKLESQSKHKKKKDENAPKKPKSGYMFFCVDKRAEVIESGVKGREVFTALGKRWKLLKDSKKKKYSEMAAEDKKRYEIEKSVYVPKIDSESDEPKEKKKQKRGPNSFILFCKDYRDKVKRKLQKSLKGDKKVEGKNVNKALGEMWKALKDDKKNKYKQKSKEICAKMKEDTKESEKEKEKDDADEKEVGSEKENHKDEGVVEDPDKWNHNE